MIAPPLGGAGPGPGMPNLALDSGLIDRLELDCQILLRHNMPPLAAQSGSRKWMKRNAPSSVFKVYHFLYLLSIGRDRAIKRISPVEESIRNGQIIP